MRSQTKQADAALGRQQLSPERAKALEAYYRSDFIPLLNKTPGFEQVTADQLLPHNDRTAEAQALFISENPNKPGEREKLVDSPANDPYTLAHFTYHEWFLNLERRFDFRDLFVISSTGTIVYSVEKQVDFGTNLVDGPYASTNLGTLYRQIMTPTDREHLISNLVGHMSQGVERIVQERALKHWYKVDADLGAKISAGIGVERSAIECRDAESGNVNACFGVTFGAGVWRSVWEREWEWDGWWARTGSVGFG